MKNQVISVPETLFYKQKGSNLRNWPEGFAEMNSARGAFVRRIGTSTLLDV